jgi:hypothetical protein
MHIKLAEDYYFWCCDWCDTENLVLWTKIHEGAYCGACHRPMNLVTSPGGGELLCGKLRPLT